MRTHRPTLLAASLCLAWAAQADTALTGTGDPARDVPAVQAAVDQGGVVTLRGRFDFGADGQVRIRGDVEIVGADGARIQGGRVTFESPLPEQLPPARPGPRITIRNLHFDGAQLAPIYIAHAGALVVAGNRVTNVRPLAREFPGVAGGQSHAGIVVGPGYGRRASLEPGFQGVLAGPVTIEDNVVDLATAEPSRTHGAGVFGMWMSGADVLVTRNVVSNVSRNAIEFIDNYRDQAGRGRIRVVANRITTPEHGFAWPGPATPNGTVLGYFWDEPAALDARRSVAIEFTDNQVELRGKAGRAVVVLGNDVKVHGNTITATQGEMPLVAVHGSGAEISRNRFLGSGRVAVGVAPFRTLAASRNRLVGNDLRGFQGADGYVFNGGSADNSCTGHQGTLKVADHGLRNRCRPG